MIPPVDGTMPERSHPDGSEPEHEGPIGPFPSWNAVYAVVVVATLLMVVLLYWFTVALDFSG